MVLSITLTEWLIAIFVVSIGSTIQAIIGYGVGVLGAPLLYLIDPQLVPGPVIVIGMMLPLMILIRDYQSVQVNDVAWALPGSIVGIIVAAVVIGHVSQQGMALLLGGFVLLSVGISFVHQFPDPQPPYITSAAVLSGFSGTITAIGGPPLALVFQNVVGPRLPGTLSAIFVPSGLISLSALGWAGRFGIEELLLGVSLIPGIVIGYLISGKLIRRLSTAWVRNLLLIVSAVAAVLIIAKGLLM